MQPVTFIIPLKYPSNAKEAEVTKSRLNATLSSLKNQADSAWRALLITDVAQKIVFQDDRLTILHRHRPKWPMESNYSGFKDTREYNAYEDMCAKRLEGASYALNDIDTEWLVFLDSDDLVHCDYVSLLLRQAPTCQRVISISGWQYYLGMNRLNYLDGTFAAKCGSCLGFRRDYLSACFNLSLESSPFQFMHHNLLDRTSTLQTETADDLFVYVTEHGANVTSSLSNWHQLIRTKSGMMYMLALCARYLTGRKWHKELTASYTDPRVPAEIADFP